jgi:hypothetical protein
MKTKNEQRTTNKMEYTRFYADIVARDAFADPGATMRTWFGSVQGREQQSRDSDMNGEVPAFLASSFKRG